MNKNEPILIACEESGVVTEAFRNRGYVNTWSCDLLPTSGNHPEWHLQQDVVPLLDKAWDMVIAFPPCTHLAVSGARYFAEKRADGRQQEAIDFFMLFANCKAPAVAIENPVGIMSTRWRKPDQIIQPYEYGHPESKKTCLWLKGLPELKPTKIMEPVWWKNQDETDYRDKKGKRYSPTHYLMDRGQVARWANQTSSGQNKLCPSPDRARLRAQTYHGIAKAMAEQYTLEGSDSKRSQNCQSPIYETNQKGR